MSTCDGLMVVSGAYFIKNFYQKWHGDSKTEKQYLFASRVASILISVFGIIFALQFKSVVEALRLAWVLPAFMGISFWCAFAWRRVNRWSAMASASTSALAYYILKYTSLWNIFFDQQPSFTQLGLIFIPVGFAVLIVVSLLTPREPQERLDEFYALLHTKIGDEEKLNYADVEILHK